MMQALIWRLGMVLLLIALCAAPAAPAAADAAAQGAAQSAALYPTVSALEDTPIPVRDRADLARRLDGFTGEIVLPTAPPAYALGDRDTFWVVNSDAERAFEVEAELRALGEHIVLWVEVGGGLSDRELARLAQHFDDVIYPTVRDLWGEEANPGVDGDPRVHGLFTSDLGATAAAYFSADHVNPVAVVPTSNAREMFFFNLDAVGSSLNDAGVESIVAHEFQHMIRNQLQTNEETWMNEGFSLLTEQIMYQRFPWEAFDFMSFPQTQLNSWAEDPFMRSANYGAATLFMLYFYQNYGESSVRLLSIDSSPRGLTAVDNTLRQLGETDMGGAAPVDRLFADWVVANLVNDPNDPRYGYPSLAGMLIAADTQYLSDDKGTLDVTAPQYAASYFQLPGVSGRRLDIGLEMPNTVQLIPTDAASGSHVWYSNRADMSNTTLTRAFDLTGVASATLQYRLWHLTERGWDYGYVMVSRDDGATWELLATPHTTTFDPHNLAYGAGYTGSSGGWLDESVSLDAYAGEVIQVRFEMITDDAINQPGIAIDDVRIPEIDYRSDFEADDGGWIAEGWLRMDNRLPQRAWVQVVYEANGSITIERWLHEGGSKLWSVPIPAGVSDASIIVAPFAPVTTVDASYSLTWKAS